MEEVEVKKTSKWLVIVLIFFGVVFLLILGYFSYNYYSENRYLKAYDLFIVNLTKCLKQCEIEEVKLDYVNGLGALDGEALFKEYGGVENVYRISEDCLNKCRRDIRLPVYSRNYLPEDIKNDKRITNIIICSGKLFIKREEINLCLDKIN